jgi:hypothetical protein
MSKSAKLVLMPNVEDIKYFKSAGQCKSDNDSNNKIRENIIANIFNLDDEYFNHPTYGFEWKNLKCKFEEIIKPLCEEPYNNIDIKHIGGMSSNHDFNLIFKHNDDIVKKIEKFEFKHNNSSVKDLVQFLELYDKDCKNKYKICSEMSYAEYYYDNYLDKYLNCDDKLKTITKPSKEEYIKHVQDIDYKHEFFSELYKNKNNQIQKKRYYMRFMRAVRFWS